MPESKGLKEARRRLNAELDKPGLDQTRVTSLRAHVTRLEREGQDVDITTGRALTDTQRRLLGRDDIRSKPSLQSRVRKRRAAEEEVGIRRGRP